LFDSRTYGVSEGPIRHTLKLSVTGSSVLGIKYKDGVMVVCDTLASYGSLSKYKDVRRIEALGKNTLLAASGEYSDFQRLTTIMKNLETDDWVTDDSTQLATSEMWSYIGRVLHKHRNKVNPLWLSCVVSGYKDNEAFLGYVDMYGTLFKEDYVATGMGAYLCLPLLRTQWRTDLTEVEARNLLDACMRILFCRDTQSYTKVTFARATAEGIRIDEPVTISASWQLNTWQKSTVDLGVVGNSW